MSPRKRVAKLQEVREIPNLLQEVVEVKTDNGLLKIPESQTVQTPLQISAVYQVKKLPIRFIPSRLISHPRIGTGGIMDSSPHHKQRNRQVLRKRKDKQRRPLEMEHNSIGGDGGLAGLIAKIEEEGRKRKVRKTGDVMSPGSATSAQSVLTDAVREGEKSQIIINLTNNPTIKLS